jgi:hypothetical protein
MEIDHQAADYHPLGGPDDLSVSNEQLSDRLVHRPANPPTSRV